MKTIKLHQIATLVLSILISATAWATPAATSPYVTDPQNEYVQDATSEAINTVNMILCIVEGMNISDSGRLNVGPYIALVDMNKCKAQGGSNNSSSSSAGASAAVNFITAIVDATRADTTSPMIAHVWMSITEEGKTQEISVKLTATTPPSVALPYGVFRLDYSGVDSLGAPKMKGFIDSSTGTLQYYETGDKADVGLNMAASSTDSGNGVIDIGISSNNPTAVTYRFNYNANYFRRSDSLNDQCFDRLKAHAKKSVWQYGTYNANDGNRVDQANPSFQLNGTFAGNSYYGNAGYWGISFQGLDLNSTAVTSATSTTTGLISGLVVTDQRPNHITETYSLSKVGGKLTKWIQNTVLLSAMDGIPFNTNADLSAVTNPAVASGYQNWQLQWDNTAGNFKVLGTQSCGPNGCSITPVANPTVTLAAFDSMPISGWSDSFGGNINIPPAATRTGSTVNVSYFSQTTVTPGTVSLTLRCLNNCPNAASIASTAAGTYSSGPQQPFGGTTASQWFSAPSLASTMPYSFDGGGLKDGATPMIIDNPLYFAVGTSFQGGVQTGRLFDDSASANAADKIAACAFNAALVCEPSNPSLYYTWTTGVNQWNQSMWLTRTNGATGTVVAFDPPQNIQYTVPTGTAYGSLSGKAIQLQFNGFGNLWGIPGYCVSPVNNAVVDCGPNTRYVPAFSIPDGATMTLGATPLIVKSLGAEIRLNDLGAVNVDAPATTACGSMSFNTSLTAPTGGAHDMSLSTDAYYIGIKPTVTTLPKVIDGIVQY